MENNIEKRDADVIDLRVVFKKVLAKKKVFFITLPIVFVLSCAIILCVPKYYTTSTMLAPEMGGDFEGGTLGSLASSFGFDLGMGQSMDAISPLLYPDLMEDNAFVANLFKIEVESADGEIKTNYYDYLAKHQKHPWWTKAIGGIKRAILPKEESKAKLSKGKFDPYMMSKQQSDVAGAIRSDVTITTDKKTGVITIGVKAQDPLICKTVADSIKNRLQLFITDYRTNKARVDLEYYTKLAKDAKKDYEEARRKYGSYADANTDVILESYKAKQTDMENDMQLKYNTYTTLNTQLQAAKAKVQERTPAFTVIKGADVPIKPTGPKRMLFVLGMCILAFFGTALFLVRKDMHFVF